MLGLAKFKRQALLASTSEVHGDLLVHPQPETYWGNVDPIGPRGVYDEAKRYAEALVMAYHGQQGVDTYRANLQHLRPADAAARRTGPDDLHASGAGERTPDRVRRRVADPFVLLRRRFVRGLVLLAESREHVPINLGATLR